MTAAAAVFLLEDWSGKLGSRGVGVRGEESGTDSGED
jgi:hypothetical protein